MPSTVAERLLVISNLSFHNRVLKHSLTQRHSNNTLSFHRPVIHLDKDSQRNPTKESLDFARKVYWSAVLKICLEAIAVLID